jgi:hypothetical protein
MFDGRPNTYFLRDILDVPPEKLLFFVGAGVSSAPPACLPTGEQLRRELVKFLRDASAFRALPGGVAQNLRTAMEGGSLPVPGTEKQLRIHGLPLEGLLDIYQARIGDEPVTRFLAQNLASGASNAAHAALAGCLVGDKPAASAVLTTNYDTLIEQCMPSGTRERLVAFREDHTSARSAGMPVLFKVHGSIDEPSSVVSSLSAERALPAWKGEFLLRLIKGKTVVVFGYSGCDFDICPLLLNGEAARFYWNSYDASEDVSRDVAGILNRPGTVAMSGDAIPFFREFALARHLSSNGTPERKRERPRNGLPKKSEKQIDVTAFPAHEAGKWACLAALDVGAGSAALALLDSLADEDPTLREQSWYWLAQARAHFLESHSTASLRQVEQAYTAALRISKDAIERIDSRSSRLGIAETRMSLLRRLSPPSAAREILREVAWSVMMVRAGVRWLGIWILLVATSLVYRIRGLREAADLDRVRLQRAAGNLHVMAAQALEALHDVLKRNACSTQLWRVVQVWAAFHLWRIDRLFEKSDNYFETQHAERLRIRMKSVSANEKAQLSEQQMDCYRRLGYVTAWSNSLRDVIRWRTEAGPGHPAELDELMGLALQAKALSLFVSDEPGTTKAEVLIADLLKRGASLPPA